MSTTKRWLDTLDTTPTQLLDAVRHRVRFALRCAQAEPLEPETIDTIRTSLANSLRHLDEHHLASDSVAPLMTWMYKVSALALL